MRSYNIKITESQNYTPNNYKIKITNISTGLSLKFDQIQPVDIHPFVVSPYSCYKVLKEPKKQLFTASHTDWNKEIDPIKQ